MGGLQQVLAIARTEFRFSFRRGAPVAATAVIGLLVGAGILLPAFAALKDWATIMQPMTPEQLERWTSWGLTLEERPLFAQAGIGDLFVFSSNLAWLMMLLALILLPIATIAAIPADRSLGVMDLLRSAPMTGATYLAGKALGLLAAVGLTASAFLLLTFALAEVTLLAALPFGLSWEAASYYLKLALLDGLPLLVCGTLLGLLAGVFFRTRRGAIFPGLLLGLLSFFAWTRLFRAPASTMPAADRIHYWLLKAYTSPAQEIQARVMGQSFSEISGFTGSVDGSQIAAMYTAILAGLALLAILARLWLFWKENF
jgi:ABC-type transport system involved in multi-copper enzyme maturation permease subunit